MTTKTDVESIDQTLNKTDLGHFVQKNSALIKMLIAALVLAIIGYSVFQHQSQKSKNELLNKIFDVTTSTVEPYLDGKIDTDEFLKKMSDVKDEVLTSSSFLPELMKANKKLIEQGRSVEAIEFYERFMAAHSSTSIEYIFAAFTIAPVYEDNKMIKKAISIYESLLNANAKFFEQRIYLELGRLYLEQKNFDKAKASLQYILDNFQNTESSKLAKFYMMKLGQSE